MKGQGNSGTLEFGGRVDTRPLIQFKGVFLLRNLPIGGRFEVRDFYSGQPHYCVETSGNLQNNLPVTFKGHLLLTVSVPVAGNNIYGLNRVMDFHQARIRGESDNGVRTTNEGDIT